MEVIFLFSIGVDRHLFGLYVVSKYLEEDSPFLKEVSFFDFEGVYCRIVERPKRFGIFFSFSVFRTVIGLENLLYRLTTGNCKS